MTTPDVPIGTLAGRQHGVFTQPQLIAADRLNAGFSTLRITDHRLKHHPAKEARRLKSILQTR